MRIAWLLGVFLFLPQSGRAVLGGTPRERAFLLDAGELPPIKLASLPDRASPEPARLRDPIPAYIPRLPARGKPILLRAPVQSPASSAPQAAAAPAPAVYLSHSVAEVEKLGEDLRDAVAPLPTLDWFLGAIRDPRPQGRLEAVEAFGYAGNFAAIPYVSAVLLRLDEDLAVRVAAARALGRIGDRRAWSFLARTMGDREPSVRLASALAIGRVTDRGGARLISRALQSEADEDVRAALAWALGSAQERRF
jgi:HEAT repeat protein